MKNISYFALFLITLHLNSFSQCFTSGGIGDFEQNILNNDFFTGDQGNGSIATTTEDKYSGNQSLKAVVTKAGNWEVRIFNQAACEFNKTAKGSYVVSFYLKGSIGDKIAVSIMDNTSDDQAKEVIITSDQWTLYQVPFQSSSNSAQGKIKVVFKDVGTYYMDQLELNSYDCSGTMGGSAAYDDCGLCAGGTTGLSAINSCTYTIVSANDPNIVFEGVLESDIDASKATLYRMKKDYVTSGVSGYYSQTRAAASAGIVVKFKTASPIIKCHFQENLSIGDDIYWHSFNIYKNDTFQFDDQGWDIELSNPKGQEVEWKIILPSYSAVELLNIELISGYNLSQINNSSKAIYIAIGNSITHGQGITDYSGRKTYSRIIADSLGYELYNWGIGGSKVYDGILTNFNTGIQPAMVSVLWGYNDVHYSSNDSYFATNTFPQYENILNTLANSYPSACIMAILSTYTSSPTKTNIRTIDSLRNGQLAIIQNLQKTHSNISYVDGWNYTDASGLNDVVHLNEVGNKSLAHGIISELPCGQSTMIESVNNNKTDVFPNPSNGIIQWETNSKYILYDQYGKLLKQGLGQVLSIQDLNAGIYFLKLDSGSHKVIKK